jgi:hypothetical protein
VPAQDMGASPSTCAGETALSCGDLEPQEVCTYGANNLLGPRADAPCDWDWAHPNSSRLCTSRLHSCGCPVHVNVFNDPISPLAKYVEEPLGAFFTYGAPILLWSLTAIVPLLYSLLRWETSFHLPRPLKDTSLQAVAAWLAICTTISVAMPALVGNLPADAWGECSNRGVCVYHMMFCESTRHASPIRHPANSWSNLPYIYTSIGMLLFSLDERLRGISRPFMLLDASYGVVLLSMAVVSFWWHASNCTAVHFLDIGLMNCVIAFYPYRFSAAAALHHFGRSEAKWSVAVAVGYAAVACALLRDALSMTDLYHEAFPTGRARYLSLRPFEVMLYIGLPGLYPVPILCRMAQRRSWGCVPAMFISAIALPLGFCFHAMERLVADLYCNPGSLVLQPTANFHVLTGVAIAAAFVQTMAVDPRGE